MSSLPDRQTIRDVQIGDGRDILDMERCELGDAGDSILGGLYKYFLAGGLDSTPSGLISDSGKKKLRLLWRNLNFI